MNKIASDVISGAISYAHSKGVAVHTFALYYDHESPALSVCIDTAENSARMVSSINAYNSKYFLKYVQSGDLEQAALWQANVGRSLSLGDFVHVNIHRTALQERQGSSEFFAGLLQACVEHQAAIVQLSPDPASLVLACSGPDNEVQFVWAPVHAQQVLQADAAAPRGLI